MLVAKTERLILPYKDCRKNLAEVPIGSIITDVKTGDLFTYQNWIDETKFTQAMRDMSEGIYGEGFPIGYITNRENKFIIAIGDGNHRALVSDLILGRVNIEIANPALAPSERPVPIRSLRRRYNTLCSEGI